MQSKFECEAEYDSWFDGAFKKLTRGVEDHQFRHFNSSLGCMVYSKEHYRAEMRKKRMIPYDDCEKWADQWDREHPRQEYDSISPKAMEIIQSLKLTADGSGNIKLGSRAIKALQGIGAIADHSKHHKYIKEGGV